MKQLKSFGAFWYDFIVGDDWHVAAMVAAGLALTAIATHAANVNAWWLLPIFVVAALVWSLHRATASRK
jgi:hypothetical protein